MGLNTDRMAWFWDKNRGMEGRVLRGESRIFQVPERNGG